jgi:hypothetical protein
VPRPLPDFQALQSYNSESAESPALRGPRPGVHEVVLPGWAFVVTPPQRLSSGPPGAPLQFFDGSILSLAPNSSVAPGFDPDCHSLRGPWAAGTKLGTAVAL